MGGPYRTPSPTRQSLYNTFEYDASPSSNVAFSALDTVTTPLSPPRLSSTNPATPNAATQVSAERFGLLTPKTPKFFLSGFRSRLSKGANYRKDQLSSSDGSTASPVSDGTSPEPTNVGGEAQEKQDIIDLSHTHEREDSPLLVDEASESESDSPVHTQFDELQQKIRDAEIAAQLNEEEDDGGKRRSTRLRTARKLTTEVDRKPVAPVSKLIEQAVVTKDPELEKVLPPESSFNDEAVEHIQADLNPTPLSLEWQLQYPPGGSTHPSYAYPQMDPRLLFDVALIPVVDGLPTVLQVPPLVLPFGWRHISWSGFLPIAFDPYHQAFKLTPIGPLPLTCEEVQQGGLAKFVPGGECHPEAGLLPDVSALSDGSDEVFNFDNLDWVLPWPKSENFDSSTVEGVAQSSLEVRPPTSATAAMSSSLEMISTHYKEALDCPDDIIDIEDAWRWLAERSQNAITAFSPSPGKSWKGTGIYQTAKKIKQPIPSLLASALAETNASPGNFIAKYLIKQNGREFCAFRSVSTPVHINIALLGDTEFTLKELLCYFPLHYVWRKAGDRLLRAGMTGSSIANMINMTRQLSGGPSCKSGTVNAALTYEAGTDENGMKVRIVRDNQKDEAETYTAEGWVYEAWELADYPLLGLAHGLVKMPEGVDAGPITHLINWCKAQGKHKVMLSNVPTMLHEAGIISLVEPGAEGALDKEVLPRYTKLLLEDRNRVLRLAKQKMTAEGPVRKKRKRAGESEQIARESMKSESTLDRDLEPL